MTAVQSLRWTNGSRRMIITRTAIIFAGLIVIACLQILFDRVKPATHETPISVYPVQVLRATDLGLHSAMASALWLNLIQQVGTFAGTYPGFLDDLNTVTTLDPAFSYPYAFAALMGPAFEPEHRLEAIAIGARGVERHVQDWQIPFYVAAAYDSLKDRENALRYFTIAAESPDIPSNVRVGALSYGTQARKRDSTRSIWESIYTTTNDDMVREQAKANLQHLAILDALEQAIADYAIARKTPAPSLEALVEGGFLPGIPQDPFGLTYTVADGGLTIHSPGVGN